MIGNPISKTPIKILEIDVPLNSLYIKKTNPVKMPPPTIPKKYVLYVNDVRNETINQLIANIYKKALSAFTASLKRFF